MKLPNKIYITNYGSEVNYSWHPERLAKRDVEYTRTDAFVEKTLNWLKEQDEMIGVSFQNDFLERFKNYMKGE